LDEWPIKKAEGRNPTGTIRKNGASIKELGETPLPMSVVRLFIVACLVVGVTGTDVFGTNIQYSVTAVPGEALGISNTGIVLAGWATWTPNGGIQNPPAGSPGLIQGWGINDAGAVAGITNVMGNATAVVWQGATVTTLPPLPLGTNSEGEAFGINDSDVVVGYSITSPRQLRAVRWTNGVAEDLGAYLGAAGVNSFARAINNAGQVIVDSNSEAALAALPDSVSFLLNGNAITPITANDGTTAGISAWAINGNGVVAGTIYLADGTYHAFTWNGSMQIAPLAESPTPGFDGAMAINDAGVVVGDSRTNQTSGGLFPFIWNGLGAPINLNDLIDPASGWELDSAWGINDSGQIVGNGLLDGVPTGFLLTPIASSSITTPEPATLTLLALAVPFLLPRRRQ